MRSKQQMPNMLMYVSYAGTIPHQAFMIYQAMFAIITPALISGAIAERMSFRAYCCLYCCGQPLFTPP